MSPAQFVFTLAVVVFAWRTWLNVRAWRHHDNNTINQPPTQGETEWTETQSKQR